MTKIYVKLYDNSLLSGSDFAQIRNSDLRRLVFSPDNVHGISVVPLQDGTLLFTNEADIGFDFSISRNRRVLAVVKYRESTTSLVINNNWLLLQDAVQNRAINQNPDLLFSENLNINFEGSALARVDLKINSSPIAGAFFTERDLIFIRMNGNHAFPRMCEHINSEASSISARLPITEAQVLAFLNNNPGFASNHINENQVLAFLQQNREFANSLDNASFKRLVQSTRWFSI